MCLDINTNSRAGLVLLVSIASAFMMAPALLNGSPFLYFDSINYLSRPDKVVQLLFGVFGLQPAEVGLQQFPSDRALPHATENLIGGRSIVYGALAWISYPFGRLWLLVVFQSVLTAWVLGLLLLRILEWSVLRSLCAVLLVTLTTPVAFFTGLAMPDFLAPLTILATVMLVLFWNRLGRGVTFGLLAVLLFAILSHSSHLALAAALWCTLAMARLWGGPQIRGELSGRGLLWNAGVFVVAVMTLQTERIAAQYFAGSELLKRPHLTAHLVDRGPGVNWVNAHCADPDQVPFAICDYRDRLPVEWRMFLFDRTAEHGVFVAKQTDPQVQRALSQQDFAFALAVARDDPARTLGFAWQEMTRQLRKIRVHEVPLDATKLPNGQVWLPQKLRQDLERSRIYSDARPLQMLSHATEAAALLSILLLLGASALILFRVVPQPPRSICWIVILVLLGLVLNAAICGVAASPYARFQARVIFLLPLTAIVLLGSFAQLRQDIQITSRP